MWDEFPMANRGAVACSDDLFRRIMEVDLPFGGKVMLASGDFLQTCPVVRGGSRAQVVDASVRSSPLWQSFVVRRLMAPIRNAGDPEYAAFIDAIGAGAGGPIVALWPFLSAVILPAQLIDFVFPPAILLEPTACVTRAILAPTNAQIDEYNSFILDRVQGESRTFIATDSIKEMDGVDNVPYEAAAAILDFAARRNLPGLPSHSLTIKVGGVYRLMRNMAPERGCVKNVRAVVEHVGGRLIAVRLMRPENGNRPDNEITLLPRIPFDTPIRSGHTLVRRQFPLGPAYAVTFNGCQGLTLDRVGVDLTRPVFSHGQLYTALSRARTRHHVMLRLLPGQTTTENVVYQELLLN